MIARSEVKSADQDWRQSFVMENNLNVCGNGLSEESLLETLKPCLKYEEKRKILLNSRLSPEIKDLRICMYVSACNNATLKPFPEHIVDNNQAGLEKLLYINCSIPPVVLIPIHLKKKREHVVEILHWIISYEEPRIVRVSNDVMKTINSFAVNVKTPDRIYKIMFKSRSANQLEWGAAYEQYESKLAFYSLKFCQLHTLLNAGLFEMSQIGNDYGIFVTNDLSLCLSKAPEEHVWGKSIFGKKLQVAAVVEFFPEQAKVVKTEGPLETILYLVPSSKQIQIRYLLLYTDRKETKKLIEQQNNKTWYYYALGFAALCTLGFYTRLIPSLDNLKQTIKYQIFSGE